MKASASAKWSKEVGCALRGAAISAATPERRALLGAFRQAEGYAAGIRLGAIERMLDGRRAAADLGQRTLLLRPVGDLCNITCSYCYQEHYPIASKRPVALGEMLRDILANVLPQITLPYLIYVHGGEPLLAGLAYFETLVEELRAYDLYGKVELGVQTNGILLDERWVGFFARNGFNIGLSIDGPTDLHDRARVKGSGRGTHGQVMRALRLIQDRGARYGVTAVLTAETAADRANAERLHAFMADAGVAVYDVHPAQAMHEQARSSNVDPDAFAGFMVRLFEAWLASGGSPRVRTFDFFFQSMTGFRAAACHRAGACGTVVGVEPNGDVVSCVRPFKDAAPFGNLREQPLTAVISSSLYEAFTIAERSGQEATVDCRWSHHCGSGGCPHERADASGRQSLSGRHVYCTCDGRSGGFPALFEYIQARVDQIVSGDPL